MCLPFLQPYFLLEESNQRYLLLQNEKPRLFDEHVMILKFGRIYILLLDISFWKNEHLFLICCLQTRLVLFKKYKNLQIRYDIKFHSLLGTFRQTMSSNQRRKDRQIKAYFETYMKLLRTQDPFTCFRWDYGILGEKVSKKKSQKEATPKGLSLFLFMDKST